MTLTITCNPSSFTVAASGRVCGDVWLELDGTAFPSSGWSDFAVSVVRYLAEATLRLARGQTLTARVQFYEGPLAVELAFADQRRTRLVLRCLDTSDLESDRELNSALYTPEQVYAAVLRCANSVVSGCRAIGLSSARDVPELEAHAEALSGLAP